jgi:hypothetical protein
MWADVFEDQVLTFSAHQGVELATAVDLDRLVVHRAMLRACHCAPV